jgi:hypothetical protein
MNLERWIENRIDFGGRNVDFGFAVEFLVSL